MSALAKQWQAIIAAKIGPCRVCCDARRNGHDFGNVEFHHVVPRDFGGDDVADNIVPCHLQCHADVHKVRGSLAAYALLEHLTDAEYAYCVDKAGEAIFERVYGIRYER